MPVHEADDLPSGTFAVATVGRQREQPEHSEEAHLLEEGRLLDVFQIRELLRIGQIGKGTSVRVRLRDRALKRGEASAERIGLGCIQPGMDVIHEVHDAGFAGARRGAARDDLRGDGVDVARPRRA